jgi:uncharacterized membrane protein YdbT with pleckstrin-like domain
MSTGRDAYRRESMGYVDANLVPGETVAYRARRHWIVVAPAVLGAAVLDLFGLGLVAAGHASVPMVVLGAVLLLAGSAWMAVGVIRWRATEITVTSRRVFIKTGVLGRHTTEILLAKVESVSIEESMLARLLGFGKVTVHGTGGTPETFERIARPHAFRRQVQVQIEALPARR